MQVPGNGRPRPFGFSSRRSHAGVLPIALRALGGGNPPPATITTSIALAHTMNLTVIADGIETKEQLDFLTEKDCEIGQGYFFSKPLPAPEAELRLAV